MNYVKRWSCFVHTCPPLRWGFVQKSHWNAPCSNDRRWRISCWLTTSKSVRRRQTKSFTAVRYVDRAPGRCQNVPAGRVPVDQTLPQILFFFLGERIKLNVKSWEADSEKTSRCWSSESFFFPEPPVALFTAAQSSRGTWNAVVTWQLIAPVTCSYLLLCWWRPHSTWINATRTLTGGAHNQNQSATIGVHSKNEILKSSNANLGHRHIYHFSHCSTEFITSWQKPAAGNETGHYAPFTFKSDNH